MLLYKKDLSEALSLIGRPVFVPGVMEEVSRFVPWDGGAYVLPAGNTKLPPKDMLFPSTQRMYTYSMGANPSVTAYDEAEERVIFGMRPCDMRSIERLDRVFLQEPGDTLYAARRAHTTIIALACDAPGKNCFCDSLGGSPNSAPGADVFLTDAGEAYGVQAQSRKGEALLARWRPLLIAGEVKTPEAACMLQLPKMEALPDTLSRMFEDPIFTELSAACLGCGTCTYVCPSCYCFDLGDETRGAEGVKFRCWDSCMFSDYTRMAGGADPRPTKRERLRNRYLHKFCYFHQQHGESLCVGCGRCIDACPAHLDITDLAFRLGGDEA